MAHKAPADVPREPARHRIAAFNPGIAPYRCLSERKKDRTRKDVLLEIVAGVRLLVFGRDTERPSRRATRDTRRKCKIPHLSRARVGLRFLLYDFVVQPGSTVELAESFDSGRPETFTISLKFSYFENNRGVSLRE